MKTVEHGWWKNWRLNTPSHDTPSSLQSSLKKSYFIDGIIFGTLSVFRLKAGRKKKTYLTKSGAFDITCSNSAKESWLSSSRSASSNIWNESKCKMVILSTFCTGIIHFQAQKNYQQPTARECYGDMIPNFLNWLAKKFYITHQILQVKPSHLNISINILPTILHTIREVLTGKIHLTVKVSKVGDHFLYSHDLNETFSSITVRRN